MESYFNDMKQCHKDIIPCSADKFVQADLDLIKGMIIDASQNYIEFINDITLETTNEVNMDENGDISMETDDVFGNTSDDTNMEFRRASLLLSSNRKTTEFNTTTNGTDMSELIESIETLVECAACANNNFPSGAHKCSICTKNVHVLEGCSVSCGDDEGYGERRICVSCSDKQTEQLSRPAKRLNALIKEMNSKETWCKKPKNKTKKSKYLAAAPNWHLNTNIDKKLKIGIFSNGNLSRLVYKINGKLVALRNTCGFDTIAQVMMLNRLS